MSGQSTSGSGVLVCAQDTECADEILRLAAVAGTEPELVSDAVAASKRWVAARVVVVDLAAARHCAELRLPHRPGVILVDRAGETPTDEMWHTASLIGADNVVQLPAAEAWLKDRLAPIPARSGKSYLAAVVGGSGGAGASVLAASLGLAGVRAGLRTLLIDADPLGSGIDVTLGYEKAQGFHWSDVVANSDSSAEQSVFESLPNIGELSLLIWQHTKICALPASAMVSALDMASHEADLTIVDLPRYPDESTLVALTRADSTILVVPAQVRAVFAARRIISLVEEHCRDLSCVVRGPSPARIPPREVAMALRLPLLGALQPEPRLPSILEDGRTADLRPRGPLGRLCDRLVTRWRDRQTQGAHNEWV